MKMHMHYCNKPGPTDSFTASQSTSGLIPQARNVLQEESSSQGSACSEWRCFHREERRISASLHVTNKQNIPTVRLYCLWDIMLQSCGLGARFSSSKHRKRSKGLPLMVCNAIIEVRDAPMLLHSVTGMLSRTARSEPLGL